MTNGRPRQGVLVDPAFDNQGRPLSLTYLKQAYPTQHQGLKRHSWQWFALEIAVVAATSIGALVAYDWWNARPDNFEECVLAEMRGRPKEMLRFANPLCQQRFPLRKTNVFDGLTP